MLQLDMSTRNSTAGRRLGLGLLRSISDETTYLWRDRESEILLHDVYG